VQAIYRCVRELSEVNVLDGAETEQHRDKIYMQFKLTCINLLGVEGVGGAR
jgi:hypothetical protein